jgi:hypothetical protein
VKGHEVDPVAIVAVLGEKVVTVAVAGFAVAVVMEQDLMAGAETTTGVASQATGPGMSEQATC